MGNSIGIALSLLVIVWMGFFLVKKYKPQTILFIGGLFLIFSASAMMYYGLLPAKPLLDPKLQTGSTFLDGFEVIKQFLSSNAAGLGLNIMAVGGFARYMDHIGASRALVKVTSRPLMRLHSPYLVMSATWVLGMLLGLAINSASGLAMLLMVTVFPVLVSLGVSRVGAVAAIGTTLCLDWSPSDTGTILAADTAKIHYFEYWWNYQVPVAVSVIVVVSILHYFTQKWMDKRDGHVPDANEAIVTGDVGEDKKAPLGYAILPVIPLAIILLSNVPWAKAAASDIAFIRTFFSFNVVSFVIGIFSQKMDIIKAMVLGMAVSMIVDYARTWEGKKITNDIQSFFDGMGAQLANVVTLIVAGQTFAQGLTHIGAVNTVIEAAKNSGLGGASVILIMVGIIALCSILMGSGNAPFFSFAKLVPDIATHMNVPAASMLLPMHFAASTARAVSPITAVIVVAAGMGGVSPFDVVKRTAIPMLGSLITILVVNFVLFY